MAASRPGGKRPFLFYNLQAFAPAVTARMIGGFTVLRLSGLVGTLGEDKLTKEDLLAINEQLNRIPRA